MPTQLDEMFSEVPYITLCFVLGKSVVIQNRVKEIMNLAKRRFLHLCVQF